MANGFTFTYALTDLRDGVSRRASSTGARLLGEDGQSLYDHLRLLERDTDEVDTHIRTAIIMVNSRIGDICTASFGTSSVSATFTIPDYGGASEALGRALQDYIETEATALWLADRHGDSAKTAVEEATAMLDGLSKMAKRRARPSRN